MYTRTNSNTFFLLPTIAVGVDIVTQQPFIEIAWFNFAIGFGS